MANPFGMAEFSVPQLIGLDMQMKSRRLEDMYRHKQMERQEKQDARQDKAWEKEDRRDSILGRLYSGQPTAAPAPAAPVSPIEGAAPPVAPTRSDGVQVDQQALNELFAVDPALAKQIKDWSKDAEKDALDKVKQHGELIGQAAYTLGKVRAGPERDAAFRAMTPDLIARGLTQEELAKVDLSDAGVQKYLTFGQSLADLIKEDREAKKDGREDAKLGLDRERLDLARKRENRVSRWGPQPLIGVMSNIPTDNADLDY